MSKVYWDILKMRNHWRFADSGNKKGLPGMETPLLANLCYTCLLI